ncbi:hypothetical protein ACUXCC_005628 [Cytobacillus horneckiae]|uniref:hypothetical protein n=1 Tax=Cytobacillus horneckiae TaxID=549687 RepID=UPI0019D002AC|nr:hypothetical protein [Cytobacillus horneckiae]MBN6890094.1 hypothetical protein [Cytobacillus horneckiae]
MGNKVIRLTAEIRTYAQKVADVGSRMGVTSNKFGQVSKGISPNLESISNAKRQYLSLLNEYQSQEETLNQIKAPFELEKEHNKLLVSFKKFVDATNMGIDALDVDNIQVDEEQNNKCLQLQAEASKEIVIITDEIAIRLGLK